MMIGGFVFGFTACGGGEEATSAITDAAAELTETVEEHAVEATETVVETVKKLLLML